jgi:hypothetical protein
MSLRLRPQVESPRLGNDLMSDHKIIEGMKSKLRAAVLQSIGGLSVRQAEPLTGLAGIVISRMRRGVGNHSIDLLLRAAIKLKLPVDIHIAKLPARPLPSDGREGIRRPTKRART